jgi:antitoxin HigA-1
MIRLSEQFTWFTRENLKIEPAAGPRRPTARAPMRRRQDFAFLLGSGRRLSRRYLSVCLRPTLRLPVTVTGNRLQRTGTASMALTNAEKQARYRERHLENGPKTREHFFPEATIKAKLLRLARHRKCSVPALIGDLASSAERRVGIADRQGPEPVLRRKIATTTRVSTVTGNHNSRCTEKPDRCPTDPGASLREDVIPATDKTKAEIARLLGISRQHLYDVLRVCPRVAGARCVRLRPASTRAAPAWVAE